MYAAAVFVAETVDNVHALQRQRLARVDHQDLHTIIPTDRDALPAAVYDEAVVDGGQGRSKCDRATDAKRDGVHAGVGIRGIDGLVQRASGQVAHAAVGIGGAGHNKVRAGGLGLPFVGADVAAVTEWTRDAALVGG